MDRINSLFRERRIIWLHGVRRSGKTFLCKSIPDIVYFDCEIPEVRRQVEDEAFLASQSGRTIALDEIHRLKNPAELLKIAADHHNIRIIATGSSKLEANKKFKDTLTGRKFNLHLTPATSSDAVDFKAGLDERLLHGGLPDFMMAPRPQPRAYIEWIESYWARDITGTFRIDKKDAFMKLMELLFINSGGIFEASKYGPLCELSRPTIKEYFALLSETSVISAVRPFSSGKARELTSAPKVYSFDTGFTAFFRGWEKLRSEDRGIMWEQYVLNEILACAQSGRVNYWRDKDGHELDFVLYRNARKPAAIECKWQAQAFDPGNLKVFRRLHPDGENYLVTHDTTAAHVKMYGAIRVNVAGIGDICGIVSHITGE